MIVQGKITDSKTGKPLFGVNIYISNSNGEVINPPVGVASDPDGNFNLKGVSEYDYITASYVGYKKQVKHIVTAGSVAPSVNAFNFKLEPETSEIPEFTIVADKKSVPNMARKEERNYKPLIIGGIAVLALLGGYFTYKKLKK